MESAVAIRDGEDVNLSEQFLISCNKDGWSCEEGNNSYALKANKYHHDTLGISQVSIGAVYESDNPYTATNGTCIANLPHPYVLDNWGTSSAGWEFTLPSVQEIKNLIYNQGPVSVAVCAGPQFQDYDGGIFETDESVICSGGVSHAVNLVGWDDEDEVWILRSSWRENWGENGYMRIKYGTSNVGLWTTYVEYGEPDPEPEPTITKYDFDGDGRADVGIFRPTNNLWTVKDQFYQKYGVSGDVPVPADYDGDGATDIAIFRNGLWAVNGQFYARFGIAGDIPVSADYDGDGKADLAIYRPSKSLWAVRDQFYQIYGTVGDIPVPADYNGDGKTDIAIFRPSKGLWAVKGMFYQNYGKNGDVPIPADYDGDGLADIAIYRPSNSLWAVRNQFYQVFGKYGDIAVPADYDGNGTTDIAIFRSANGLWAVKDQFYQGYGKAGDIPLPRTGLYYYAQ